MSNFSEQDLIKWGEILFSNSVRRKSSKTNDMLKPSSLNSKTVSRRNYQKLEAADVKAALLRTVKKVPEVNVKVTGMGKSIVQIKSHMDYIARTHEKDESLHKSLEDQDGNLYFGADDLLDLRDQWQDGRHVIPLTAGAKAESFNLVLSMPPGTNREAVHLAARDFGNAVFYGKNDYAFTSHDDTTHPHVHMVVKAVGYDGKRMRPWKKDLHAWRETFAEKLREHGVEANATKKYVRGSIRENEKRSVIAAEREGKLLKKKKPRSTVDRTLDVLSQSHGVALRAYREISKTLAASDHEADRNLAKDVTKFVDQMAYEKAFEQREQTKQKSIPSREQNTQSIKVEKDKEK